MLTIKELKEKLVEQVDEVDVLYWLQLTTEDIVNAFEDRIEDRYDFLVGELEEDMERLSTPD
jgi:hypothetical protein